MIKEELYLKDIKLKYTVSKYHPNYSDEWNKFILHSKNGTFLFHRDFMEYHSDRFIDCSLMIFEENKLVAVFPANEVDGCVYSHQGLTYGGLILNNNYELDVVENIFETIIIFLKERGVSELLIKQMPYIYHKRAAHEMEYLLYKKQAVLYRKDLNLAVDYSRPLAISKSKLKHFRRVINSGLELRKDNNFELFWDEVLIPRLKERHNVSPVHTKEEIRLLHNRFPENIVQYNVYYNDEVVAGITLFCSDNIVKSQYGATTATGEKMRALDYIFITLIEEYKNKTAYFDMGTVTENNGMSYNKGLLKQKRELGCDIYLQDFYSLQI